MRRLRSLILLLVASSFFSSTLLLAQSTDPKPAKLSRSERKARLASLAEKYRQFLLDVDPILQPAERDTFLLMESDAQRDLFIEDFWRRRDPHGNSADNGYRADYYARLEEALKEFQQRSSEMFRIFMARGRPTAIHHINCYELKPIQIWEYVDSPGLKGRALLLFVSQDGGSLVFRLWTPLLGTESLKELLSPPGEAYGVQCVFYGIPGDLSCDPSRLERCDGRSNISVLRGAISSAQMRKFMTADLFMPPPVNEEEQRRFLRTAVIRNPNAPVIEADLAVAYPSKRGERTEVEISISIPSSQLKAKEVGESKAYHFDVTGETLKNDEIFERFLYRFDVPASGAAGKIPIVLTRHLWHADYKIRLKVTDVNSGGEAILERDITVPELAGPSAQGQKAAGQETAGAEIRIIPLPDSTVTGFRKIETLVAGDRIKAVEFYLDGKKIMLKRSRPFELELDFGKVPQVHRVRALGLDDAGKLVDGDEVIVNTGMDRLRARIVSPRFGKNLKGNVRVELEVTIPEGKELEFVELYLNEARLATMFAPPFVQIISIPADLAVGYLRAVAKVKGDEEIAEDLVFINAPEVMEEVTVHLVELPTTVLRDEKPVLGLPQSAFRVYDTGKAVEIVKFEQVKNVPLSIGVAVDSSGSMKKRLGEAQKAASSFLHAVMKPGDKAFVVAFDERPRLIQKWSSTLSDLDASLASLRTEDSTALHDALVFSLYNFYAVKGQKALILLTDGRDTASRFTFDQALEYAKRSGLPIYTIGLSIGMIEVDVRYRLGRLSTETGGTAYFIENAAELRAVYEQIQTELRAQYLLGFYPPPDVKPGSAWREVTVEVEGAKAKTLRGYYP